MQVFPATPNLGTCPHCDYQLDASCSATDPVICSECGKRTPIAELLDPKPYALRRVRSTVGVFLAAHALVIILTIALNFASANLALRVQALGGTFVFLFVSSFIASVVAFCQARRARAETALLIMYGIIFPMCGLIPGHLALFVVLTLIR